MNYGSSKSTKIILSKSIFYVKNWRYLLKKTFFSNFNFWTTLFSKIMPNFWQTVSHRRIFFVKILSIFDIENWLSKYHFGTFWRTITHRRTVLKKFPLSMLILGQKSCILGPTIFKIRQPNWPDTEKLSDFQPFEM